MGDGECYLCQRRTRYGITLNMNVPFTISLSCLYLWFDTV